MELPDAALSRLPVGPEGDLADRPHRSLRIPDAKEGHMNRRHFNKALAAATLATATPFGIVRAQAQKLRVGVLLPRSGVQAGIGQDCHRGVEVTTKVLADLGLPALDIMNGDTE